MRPLSVEVSTGLSTQSRAIRYQRDENAASGSDLVPLSTGVGWVVDPSYPRRGAGFEGRAGGDDVGGRALEDDPDPVVAGAEGRSAMWAANLSRCRSPLLV